MKIGDNSVNARGLSKVELQEVIDRTVAHKDKPILDLLDDLGKAFLQLIEYIPAYAEKLLDVIKVCYPDLLKAAMQEVTRNENNSD